MIIAQSSHQYSIVLDCFAGSGSTLWAAHCLQRRWIGIDSSDVAIATIQQRFGLFPIQSIEYCKIKHFQAA